MKHFISIFLHFLGSLMHILASKIKKNEVDDDEAKSSNENSQRPEI